MSLNEALLPVLGLNDDAQDELILRLPGLLREADFAGLESYFKALYAGLPHDWYRNNPIAKYEGHSFSQVYASVFYSHFAALGVRSEEHTSELQSRPHLVCRLLLEK